jgi:hypothetical protein
MLHAEDGPQMERRADARTEQEGRPRIRRAGAGTAFF